MIGLGQVRSERYFYGNTLRWWHAFEYLADPWPSSGSWACALGCWSSVGLAQISPFLNLGLTFLLMFLFPWMLTRSLAFRACHSAWRSIRFGFGWQLHGQVTPVLHPLRPGMFSLYLAFRWSRRLQTEMVGQSASLGGNAAADSCQQASVLAICCWPLWA